ncbi:DUF3768 domain-containing protein [Rhizobium sp. DKSPLA3]|uniref:DUF3768 domain-containing protein n=1 Tax=Rhizobium quercicola TaxID=2901226 RepID=A0A9X1NYX0_9HYPH|nr:DUF3768 domain-containing protein [Rhizobium quercicola]MCD7111813.1 DUF3768 domain-containing protein [Rhizobium quercicola]
MSPLPSGGDRTSRIRQLNDMLRGLPIPPFGQLVITRSVNELPEDERVAVLDKVCWFDAFTPDNDPHGEHDFGAFEHNGTRYFWKIDYYDLAMEMLSPDPADPTVTSRVLTVMRADEY